MRTLNAAGQSSAPRVSPSSSGYPAAHIARNMPKARPRRLGLRSRQTSFVTPALQDRQESGRETFAQPGLSPPLGLASFIVNSVFRSLLLILSVLFRGQKELMLELKNLTISREL